MARIVSYMQNTIGTHNKEYLVVSSDDGKKWAGAWGAIGRRNGGVREFSGRSEALSIITKKQREGYRLCLCPLSMDSPRVKSCISLVEFGGNVLSNSTQSESKESKRKIRFMEED